jgi:hypothetical protein
MGDYGELSLRGIRSVLVAASDALLRVSPLLDGNKCLLSLLELGMAYVVSPVPQIELTQLIRVKWSPLCQLFF